MEHIILFAKVPRPGQVKTRLCPPLSPDAAAALHEAMLFDQVDFLRSLETPARSIEVCLDASAHLPGVTYSLQGAGDLGDRLGRAFDRAFARGCSRVAVLGGDAPTLPRALVEDALGHLAAGAPASLVPAVDGGYVAIALARPAPHLFDRIPWGRREVLEATWTRAAERGTPLALTAPWADVDTPADLVRLRRECAADPARAPRTAVLLERLAVV